MSSLFNISSPTITGTRNDRDKNIQTRNTSIKTEDKQLHHNNELDRDQDRNRIKHQHQNTAKITKLQNEVNASTKNTIDDFGGGLNSGERRRRMMREFNIDLLSDDQNTLNSDQLSQILCEIKKQITLCDVKSTSENQWIKSFLQKNNLCQLSEILLDRVTQSCKSEYQTHLKKQIDMFILSLETDTRWSTLGMEDREIFQIGKGDFYQHLRLNGWVCGEQMEMIAQQLIVYWKDYHKRQSGWGKAVSEDQGKYRTAQHQEVDMYFGQYLDTKMYEELSVRWQMQINTAWEEILQCNPRWCLSNDGIKKQVVNMKHLDSITQEWGWNSEDAQLFREILQKHWRNKRDVRIQQYFQNLQESGFMKRYMSLNIKDRSNEKCQKFLEIKSLVDETYMQNIRVEFDKLCDRYHLCDSDDYSNMGSLQKSVEDMKISGDDVPLTGGRSLDDHLMQERVLEDVVMDEIRERMDELKQYNDEHDELWWQIMEKYKLLNDEARNNLMLDAKQDFERMMEFKCNSVAQKYWKKVVSKKDFDIRYINHMYTEVVKSITGRFSLKWQKQVETCWQKCIQCWKKSNKNLQDQNDKIKRYNEVAQKTRYVPQQQINTQVKQQKVCVLNRQNTQFKFVKKENVTVQKKGLPKTKVSDQIVENQDVDMNKDEDALTDMERYINQIYFQQVDVKTYKERVDEIVQNQRVFDQVMNIDVTNDDICVMAFFVNERDRWLSDLQSLCDNDQYQISMKDFLLQDQLKNVNYQKVELIRQVFGRFNNQQRQMVKDKMKEKMDFVRKEIERSEWGSIKRELEQLFQTLRYMDDEMKKTNLQQFLDSKINVDVMCQLSYSQETKDSLIVVGAKSSDIKLQTIENDLVMLQQEALVICPNWEQKLLDVKNKMCEERKQDKLLDYLQVNNIDKQDMNDIHYQQMVKELGEEFDIYLSEHRNEIASQFMSKEQIQMMNANADRQSLLQKERLILSQQEEKQIVVDTSQLDKEIERYCEHLKQQRDLLQSKQSLLGVGEGVLFFDLSGWGRNEKWLNNTVSLVLKHNRLMHDIRVDFVNDQFVWDRESELSRTYDVKEFKMNWKTRLMNIERAQSIVHSDWDLEIYNYLQSVQQTGQILNMADWCIMVLVCLMEEAKLLNGTVCSNVSILEQRFKDVFCVMGEGDEQQKLYCWQRISKEIYLKLKRWEFSRKDQIQINDRDFNLRFFGQNHDNNSITSTSQNELQLIVNNISQAFAINEGSECKQQQINKYLMKQLDFDQVNKSKPVRKEQVDFVNKFVSERPMDRDLVVHNYRQDLQWDREVHQSLQHSKDILDDMLELPKFCSIFNKDKTKMQFIETFKANGMNINVKLLKWLRQDREVIQNDQLLDWVVDLETYCDAATCREWIMRQTNMCMDYLWDECCDQHCTEYHDGNMKRILYNIFQEKMKYNKQMKSDQSHNNNILKKYLFGDFENMLRINNAQRSGMLLTKLDETSQQNLNKYMGNVSQLDDFLIDLKIVRQMKTFAELGYWGIHCRNNIEMQLMMVYAQHQNINLLRRDCKRWQKATLLQRKMSQQKIIILQMQYIIADTMNWENSHQQFSVEELRILAVNQDNGDRLFDEDFFDNPECRLQLFRWRNEYLNCWYRVMSKYTQNHKDNSKRGSAYLEWNLWVPSHLQDIKAIIRPLTQQATEEFNKVFVKNKLLQNVQWQQNMAQWLSMLEQHIVQQFVSDGAEESLIGIDYTSLEERQQMRVQRNMQIGLQKYNPQGIIEVDLIEIGQNTSQLWKNVAYRKGAYAKQSFWRVLKCSGKSEDVQGWDWSQPDAKQFLLDNGIIFSDMAQCTRMMKLNYQQVVKTIWDIIENWRRWANDIGSEGKILNFRHFVSERILNGTRIAQTVDGIDMRIVLPFDWADDFVGKKDMKDIFQDKILLNILENAREYTPDLWQQYLQINKEVHQQILNSNEIEDLQDIWQQSMPSLLTTIRGMKRQKFQNQKYSMLQDWLSCWDLKNNITNAQKIWQEIVQVSKIQLPKVYHMNNVICVKEEVTVFIDHLMIEKYTDTMSKWQDLKNVEFQKTPEWQHLNKNTFVLEKGLIILQQ